jgi:amino acid transporter
VASLFRLGDIITGLMVARILVQFVGQIVGLFILRRYRPEIELPFRMWLYPLPAVWALVGWLYVFGSAVTEDWKFLVYALGTIAAGLVAFFIIQRRKREWPFSPR